jgi:hypothetical protein
MNGYFAPDPELPFLAVTGNSAPVTGTSFSVGWSTGTNGTEVGYPQTHGCLPGVYIYDCVPAQPGSWQFTIKDASAPGTMALNAQVVGAGGVLGSLPTRRDPTGAYYYNCQTTIPASTNANLTATFSETIAGANLTMYVQSSNDLVNWTTIASFTPLVNAQQTIYSSAITAGTYEYLRVFYEGASGLGGSNVNLTQWNIVLNVAPTTASTFAVSQGLLTCTPSVWGQVSNIGRSVRVTAAHCNMKYSGSHLNDEGAIIAAYHETPDGFGSFTNSTVVSQFADVFNGRLSQGVHFIWCPTKEGDYKFCTLLEKRPQLSYFSFAISGMDPTATVVVDVVLCYEIQHSSQLFPLEPVYAAPDMIAALTNVCQDVPRMRENPLHLEDVRRFLAKSARVVAKAAPYVAKGAALAATLL